MKNFQKVSSGQKIFRNKNIKIKWYIMWWKLVILGRIGIQPLNIIYVSYLGKTYENLTNKIQYFQRFKNSKRLKRRKI